MSAHLGQGRQRNLSELQLREGGLALDHRAPNTKPAREVHGVARNPACPKCTFAERDRFRSAESVLTDERAGYVSKRHAGMHRVGGQEAPGQRTAA